MMPLSDIIDIEASWCLKWLWWSKRSLGTNPYAFSMQMFLIRVLDTFAGMHLKNVFWKFPRVNGPGLSNIDSDIKLFSTVFYNFLHNRPATVCNNMSLFPPSSPDCSCNIHRITCVDAKHCAPAIVKHQLHGLNKIIEHSQKNIDIQHPITRSMGPTWGPPGAERTQVSPMLAPWILLSVIPLFHDLTPNNG